MSEVCELCREEDQRHEHHACAFEWNESRTFSSNNWGCKTMLALRDLAIWGAHNGDRELQFWSKDQHLGVIPWDGKFILLGWYKYRGKIEWAKEIDGSYEYELSEETALDVLRHPRGEREADRAEADEPQPERERVWTPSESGILVLR